MKQIFKNRQDAGLLLAAQISLLPKADLKNAIILALPRGGVPVAQEISKKLDIPFDVLIVRKIGHPFHPEYGIGAITENNIMWMDPEAVGLSKVTSEQIQQVLEVEKAEINRRLKKFRSERSLPDLKNKTVILVDDGLATGVTARVAGLYAKSSGATKVILAIPICSGNTAQRLKGEIDHILCLNTPRFFQSVGEFYRNFAQLTDDEVIKILSNQQRMGSTINEAIERNARPLKSKSDIKYLVDQLASSNIVMLGESSHGTQEFYEWRKYISEDLIARHGFNFIAVEGDWPPRSELNCFIRGQGAARSARTALKHFKRWPTWIWANTEILDLIQWLKDFNNHKDSKLQVGFHGLDVYSLFESVDEVLKVLRKFDPSLALQAKASYECFSRFNRNEKSYAKHLIRFPEGCEAEVLNVLKTILHRRLNNHEPYSNDFFDAEQNARIVKNAANYYHAMIHGTENSWNVRDRHMLETLDVLLRHYGPNAKGIIWAHNTHIGDYRATNMLEEEQINIGGLAREKWGNKKVSLLGFGTYQGEVIASQAWDGPTEIMPIPPGIEDSYEMHFHNAAKNLKENAYFLWFKDNFQSHSLHRVLGHRAIGVVYGPSYERHSNYIPTSLSQYYDGFVFFDHTAALTPFAQKFSREEMPETWPQGL